MGIDLGIADYIGRTVQNDASDGARAIPTITGNGWSIANSRVWSNLLNSGMNGAVQPGNDQSGALRNFLSLYAVTQNDSVQRNG
jgi:hypothetical protein